MAVVDVAEQGKYFNPHDARIGGVLCLNCQSPLKWAQMPSIDDYIMESTCCSRKFILKESLDFKLEINDD